MLNPSDNTSSKKTKASIVAEYLRSIFAPDYAGTQPGITNEINSDILEGLKNLFLEHLGPYLHEFLCSDYCDVYFFIFNMYA